MEQVKIYGININVEGLEDDKYNMYNNTYLTKIRITPISSMPDVDIEEEFDVIMAGIIERTGKWVELIAKRSQSKSMATQVLLVATTPSSS